MPEELKKATKERIFRVAAELFSRDGYYKVSVREICEAAEVTKPVLYYYYKDKENLLCEMMKETRQIIEQFIDENIKPEMRFVDQLEGTIKFYIWFLKKYPHLMKFLTFIQFMASPDKVREFKYSKAKEDWGKIFTLFQKAQANGELLNDIDHKVLAQNYLGGIIISLSNFMMGHLSNSEFEKELYTYLGFWKKQFVIDKN